MKRKEKEIDYQELIILIKKDALKSNEKKINLID